MKKYRCMYRYEGTVYVEVEAENQQAAHVAGLAAADEDLNMALSLVDWEEREITGSV